MEHRFPNGAVLRALQGDITMVPVDAIVNAANSALAGGGGVDGAIHRAGGPSLMRELDEIRAIQRRCPPGSAVVTSAGNLPAKWIFHAVGPVYHDGEQGEPELLASCYTTCLRLADERGAASISFPAISTGAYGYPMQEAARVAVNALSACLSTAIPSVREVLLVLFDAAALKTFEREISKCV